MPGHPANLRPRHDDEGVARGEPQAKPSRIVFDVGRRPTRPLRRPRGRIASGYGAWRENEDDDGPRGQLGWTMHGLIRIGLCLMLAGCVGSTASSPSASPAASLGTHGEQTDGPFRLDLDVARAAWSSAESIEGIATLSYLGAGSTTIGGTSTLIIFDISEVGGSRHVEGVVPADCAPHPIGPDSPIASGLTKSGAYDAGQTFIANFLNSPGYHLPPGAWDITAFTSFEESMCANGNPWHTLRATVRVRVTG